MISISRTKLSENGIQGWLIQVIYYISNMKLNPLFHIRFIKRKQFARQYSDDILCHVNYLSCLESYMFCAGCVCKNVEFHNWDIVDNGCDPNSSAHFVSHSKKCPTHIKKLCITITKQADGHHIHPFPPPFFYL